MLDYVVWQWFLLWLNIDMPHLSAIATKLGFVLLKFVCRVPDSYDSFIGQSGL